MSQHPEQNTISFSDLTAALGIGMQQFKNSMLFSLGYSTLFTLVGFALYMLLELQGMAPMSHSLAGGFMLIGPAIVVGFFKISDAVDEGRKPSMSDILYGFLHSPVGLWGASLLCLFLFMIWISEAATVYAFVIATEPVTFMGMVSAGENVNQFIFYTSLGGLVIAFITFVASAFSVPLLVYTKLGMVQAIVASISAVFRNFLVMMTWAMLLVLLVMVAAWFLPLLPLSLPVAAYSSLALYRAVFPQNLKPSANS